MINATEMRKGMIIIYENELYQVFEYKHLTPGNLRAIIQTKLRNLASGTIKEFRFRSSDRVEKAFLDTHELMFMYSDSGGYHFMNNETYEQFTLSEDELGDGVRYLKADTVISVQFHNQRPVGIQLPASVELKIVETDPPIKNATVSNVTKPAKLETGLVINVPPFINEGELVRVNTETGDYLGRA